ncbi:MAG: N-acetylmuramoyl-L-alanine amidase [Cyanobacteria bacterium REEB459]|nr:N-acetylmuramoyl-L-alanine amidase [Cyanobacteria bacterium REEB459]
MKWQLGWALPLGSLVLINGGMARAELGVVYPPAGHQTTADRIFFIGAASPDAPVLLNGVPIEQRSPLGYFAPSLPLQLGPNRFSFTQGQTHLDLTVLRLPVSPALPSPPGLLPASLQPAVDLARPLGEPVCLGAMGPVPARVTATLAGHTYKLYPHPHPPRLAANDGVLTNQVAPQPEQDGPTLYQTCLIGDRPGRLGRPTYSLTYRGQTVTATAPGTITILAKDDWQLATVTAAVGVARTGPSTDYSRLTPLPRGTQAMVTGRQGEWLRLDYGGWIRASETKILAVAVPSQSLIRGITSRVVGNWTEVYFPLQSPVPLAVSQTQDSLTLTLYNTTAQTDTLFTVADGLIDRLDWQSPAANQVQYQFRFKTRQQWGYKLRYQGTTLVLALKHPPQLGGELPLQGTIILLDPGHGGEEPGARGADGTPEKTLTLELATRVQAALESRGAQVVLTRSEDKSRSPGDRALQIMDQSPTLAVSLHYNALPDNGDALHTAGIGAFWFQTQAHDLARFLHDYLVRELDRPSYGVYWNNLALTRPTAAPAVLLELGFMTNPVEFEWVQNPQAQAELAVTLANALTAWIVQATQ